MKALACLPVPPLTTRRRSPRRLLPGTACTLPAVRCWPMPPLSSSPGPWPLSPSPCAWRFSAPGRPKRAGRILPARFRCAGCSRSSSCSLCSYTYIYWWARLPGSPPIGSPRLRNCRNSSLSWPWRPFGLHTDVVRLVKTGGKPILLGFCCWVGITGVSLLMQHLLGLL